MARFAVVLSLVLAAACFGQGEEKYRSRNWHFSFSLPEGWEVVTDKTLIEEQADNTELRNEDMDVFGFCRKKGEDGKENFILIQGERGDIGRGGGVVVYEEIMRGMLCSDHRRRESVHFLKGLKQELIEEGCSADEANTKKRLGYDIEKHVLCETLAVPHKSKGAVGVSTLNLLGSHRMIVLNIRGNAANSQAFLDMVDGIIGSFAFDKNYGFGEAPVTDRMRVVWRIVLPFVSGIIAVIIISRRMHG